MALHAGLHLTGAQGAQTLLLQVNLREPLGGTAAQPFGGAWRPLVAAWGDCTFPRNPHTWMRGPDCALGQGLPALAQQTFLEPLLSARACARCCGKQGDANPRRSPLPGDLQRLGRRVYPPRRELRGQSGDGTRHPISWVSLSASASWKQCPTELLE